MLNILKCFLSGHYKDTLYYKSPGSRPTLRMNYIFQRIFGINGDSPWSVHYTNRVMRPDRIEIGRKVDISFAVSGHLYIQGGNGIKIGDDTLIAPGVKIVSTTHDEVTHDGKPGVPIIIGKHCWLGANCVIVAGVEIGDNVIVAAGSVVTKSVPSNVVVGGVPAKIIRKVKTGNTPSEIIRAPQLN